MRPPISPEPSELTARRRYSTPQLTRLGGLQEITQGLQAMSAARVFAPGAVTPPPGRKNFCKSLDGYSFEVKGAGSWRGWDDAGGSTFEGGGGGE